MPIEQAYLLKGWLLGQTPPAEITQAVEVLIASLKPHAHAEGVEHKPSVRITLPAIRVPNDPEVFDDQQDQPVEESPSPEVIPKAKKRHNWSPEAREAQAQRMKERIAAGKMGKKQDVTRQVAASEPEFTPSDLRITVPAPSRKSGLTDADWPEIKKMLASGRSRTSIASDFDEESEDLDYFIASCQRREQKLGEDHALR